MRLNETKLSDFDIIDNKLLGYDGTESTITIPKKIKVITAEAFENNFYIEKVIIPGTVETIETSAFEKCPNLKTVVLNEGLTHIEMRAFFGCSQLSEIEIPLSVKTTGKNAFTGIAANHTVGDLQYVGNWVVGSNSIINDITFKPGTIGIASCAFDECDVKVILFPQGLLNIASGAMEYLHSLKYVSIPESVNSMEQYAICQCENLQGIITTNPYVIDVCKKSSVLKNIPIIPSLYETDFFDTEED